MWKHRPCLLRLVKSCSGPKVEYAGPRLGGEGSEHGAIHVNHRVVSDCI